MEYSTREIIWIIGAVLSICATGIPSFIGLIRKTKQFVKARNWNKVMEVLPKLIAEAEHFTNYRGQEKKEFVKSRLAVFAIKNKIAFDETRFEEAIDNIVKLTREVNKRDKDSQPQIQEHYYLHPHPEPHNHF